MSRHVDSWKQGSETARGNVTCGNGLTAAGVTVGWTGGRDVTG